MKNLTNYLLRLAERLLTKAIVISLVALMISWGILEPKMLSHTIWELQSQQ